MSGQMIRCGNIPTSYNDNTASEKKEKTMEIKKIEYNFSICRLKDFSKVRFDSEFCFAGKTDEEYSLVCVTEDVPDNTVVRNDGWRAFRIQGGLDFSLTGVVSSISSLLAGGNIGIFAISTYNTDYILTKAENFEKALQLLDNAGFKII